MLGQEQREQQVSQADNTALSLRSITAVLDSDLQDVLHILLSETSTEQRAQE